MTQEPRIRIPLDWVIVDAIGALLAAAGVYGLIAGSNAAVPELGSAAVAWMCLVSGIALMVLALAKIIGRIVAQRGETALRR
jgi:hypothetical protein